jgi:uncharacterized membrane protein HdeD (DUF308 family)
MPAIAQYVPYILVGVILILIGGSVIYVATQVGTNDTRNELQKSIAVLAIGNIVGSILLGFLLYFYMTQNPDTALPLIAVMFMFSIFLSIMSLSVSLVQKLN